MQLQMLCMGLLALGVADEIVVEAMKRATLSNMPRARALVFETLHDSEETMTSYEVAHATGMAWKVADRALGDWEAVGIAEQGVAVNHERGKPGKSWRLKQEWWS